FALGQRPAKRIAHRARHAIGEIADPLELDGNIAQLLTKVRAKKISSHRENAPSMFPAPAGRAARPDPPSPRPRPPPVRAGSFARTRPAAGAARPVRSASLPSRETASCLVPERRLEQFRRDLGRPAQPTLDAHPRQLVVGNGIP